MANRGRTLHYESSCCRLPCLVLSRLVCLSSFIMDTAITRLLWVAAMCGVVFAQDTYLPPKPGSGPSRKPVEEPTMPANYDFSYEVQDNAINLDFGHNEKRKDNQASGSYHVLLPDGRMQLVEYEAGPDGYKPVVTYMGTATFPAASEGDKFDGYHYNAASNRESVRRPAPRSSPPGVSSSAPAEPAARDPTT